ncbi:hypothetical protein BRYFOR_09635 [Marvinbryantia formatexigens DSM 14469]|uniref:Uncharacterized protein n=1 Tax=Marvinbryantia formatexigens DSM 14469 TaxID=478749 RepID=C6LLT8_9FIRM|nr:hypothetical protein BRYFOR_09635 [Marvinbryantia formatexigens DSM 14469]
MVFFHDIVLLRDLGRPAKEPVGFSAFRTLCYLRRQEARCRACRCGFDLLPGL